MPRIPERQSTRRQVAIAGGGLMSPRARNEAIASSRDSIASALRPACVGGLAETNERLGPFGMSRRGERERPLEARERRGGIEAERALARERQESQRRRLELGRLSVCPAARASSSAVE